MAGKRGQRSAMPTTTPDKYTEDFLFALDGRCKTAKVLKHRLAVLTADLGGDLSYQQQSLARRVIFLEARIEAWEADFAEGRKVPMNVYFPALNSLVGLYRTLGTERRSKQIPSLRNYIEEQQ